MIKLSMCMSPYPLAIRIKKPLPKWFNTMLKKTHTIRYKDLLVPDVTMTVENKSFDNADVGIAFHVNNFRIFGWTLIFPRSWGKGLSKMHIDSGFQDKFTRHLNMIKKGSSYLKPQPLKTLVDTEFGINSIIKLRPKYKRPKPIKVVGQSLGQLMGQLTKKYPKNPPYPIINYKKKRQKFNPSKRNSP